MEYDIYNLKFLTNYNGNRYETIIFLFFLFNIHKFINMFLYINYIKN